MFFAVLSTKKCPFNRGNIFYLTLMCVYTLLGKKLITDEETIDI